MSLAKQQMSKHITKIKGPKKNMIPKQGGGNKRKIGESTAKSMQDKTALKKRPKGFDEEIDSDNVEDLDEQDLETLADEHKRNKMGKSMQEDPFFAGEVEKNETLEERRLRMTKKLLEELQQPGQKDDFFESLQSGGVKPGQKGVETEVDIFNEEEDDLLTRRLKYQILEKKGKLFYNIADSFTAGSCDEDDY